MLYMTMSQLTFPNSPHFKTVLPEGTRVAVLEEGLEVGVLGPEA